MRFVTRSKGFSLMMASTTLLYLAVCQLPAAADGTGMKNAVIKLRVAGRPITGIILNGIRRPKKRHPPVWPRIFRDWNTHFKLRKRATSLRPPAVVHSER